jgi:integrase/recombinase XerD
LAIKLLYAAGLRVSELCSLRCRDVMGREGSGLLTIFGKGEKTRHVTITGETWEDLQDITYRLTSADEAAEDERLFSMSRQQAWEVVRKAARRAGIRRNVSPHFLRHSHASHALQRGCSLALIQRTLGRASVATTSRYLHCQPGESSGKYLPI